MSNAAAGAGAKLKYGDGGSPEVFTAVVELKKVGRSGTKADLEDVTNLDSPGAYREYLPTLLDGGEIAFEGNYIAADATQTQLQTKFDGRTKSNWQLALPNSIGHWSFAAYVTAFDYDIEFDKAMKISGKIKVTGQATFTAGS
ncbi:MAG TPA: phage tail tube protein [Candidatus Acidoferrum sp.]|jgi:predicted secreted protein|nr:phage tail tube protein [Candidatus Acidoferrum sp.]